MEGVNVYCIIVTYNAMQYIKKCLQFLAESTCVVHTIIIDNASTDATVSFIKNNYPEITLIEESKNLGFGQANNIGLVLALKSNASHLFLLNQDVYIERETIEKLVIAQTLNKQYGILSPIHANGNGDEFDDHFYNYFLQSDIKNLLRKVILKKENISEIIETKFVNAAAWLLSRECVEKTGGFDPIFFHYGEDDNFGNRVLFNGFKIGIITDTIVRHDRDVTVSSFHSNQTFSFKRDSIIFLNQASDPHQSSYKILIVKRFLRYSFLYCINLLSMNKKAMQYNFSMAKFVAGSYPKLRKSRAAVISNKMPHLN